MQYRISARIIVSNIHFIQLIYLTHWLRVTCCIQDLPEPQMTWNSITEVNGLMHWLQNQFYVVMWAFDPAASIDPETGLPDSPPFHMPGRYLSSSLFLGPVRLRQARVPADSCKVRLPHFLCPQEFEAETHFTSVTNFADILAKSDTWHVSFCSHSALPFYRLHTMHQQE